MLYSFLTKTLSFLVVSALSISCVVLPKHHPRGVVVKRPHKVIKRHYPSTPVIVTPRHRPQVYRKPYRYNKVVTPAKKQRVQKQRQYRNSNHSRGWARLR